MIIQIHSFLCISNNHFNYHFLPVGKFFWTIFWGMIVFAGYVSNDIASCLVTRDGDAEEGALFICDV